MEAIINRLYEAGIYTVLATPSAAIPRWMAVKYPEVLMVNENRVRNLPSNRHNFCPTSPIMRSRIRKLNQHLAERFAAHPGVILWHLSNELGCNVDGARCHCPLCQQAFQNWLWEKYGTLDNLNHSWWTDFWSRQYTDWDQIESPAPHGETCIHGLKLDWNRFHTDQIASYCQEEIQALRSCGVSLPVTVNMMYYFKPYNYAKLSPLVGMGSAVSFAWSVYALLAMSYQMTLGNMEWK